MQRKCAYCETEIDLKAHGSTNYCSKLCRSRAASQRGKEQIQTNPGGNMGNEKLQEENVQTQEGKGTSEAGQSQARTNGIGNSQGYIEQYAPTQYRQQPQQEMFSYLPPQLIGMYDERFKLHVQIQQLMADNARLDERNKQLEKDKVILENTIAEKQMIIDDLENQVESEEGGGSIFGIPHEQIGQAVLPTIMSLLSKHMSPPQQPPLS